MSSERTPAQLRQHYEIEKALATRLRNASRSDRLSLYQEIYNELYRQVPDHPMLTRKVTPEETAARVAKQLHLLSTFITPGATFLEVGAGDCALSFAVSQRVAKVYGLEVSKVISQRQDVPSNFELVISDGTNIPVPDGSVDLAYSNQLMEHLHPDDAAEQLRNICRALCPGGAYVCTTPHRLQGPTDISQLFDDVATGLHLREYSYGELDNIFRQAGFAQTHAYVAKSGDYYRVSTLAMRLFESLASGFFGGLPYSKRQAWIGHKPFTLFQQGINIIGYKAY
jgi:SAM-dependent methyltransferase